MFKVITAAFLIQAAYGKLVLDTRCTQKIAGIRLAHFNNCSQFLVCSKWFIARIQSCPNGLFFNAKYSVCDYPSRSGCSKERSISNVNCECDCTTCCPVKGNSTPTPEPFDIPTKTPTTPSTNCNSPTSIPLITPPLSSPSTKTTTVTSSPVTSETPLTELLPTITNSEDSFSPVFYNATIARTDCYTPTPLITINSFATPSASSSQHPTSAEVPNTSSQPTTAPTTTLSSVSWNTSSTMITKDFNKSTSIETQTITPTPSAPSTQNPTSTAVPIISGSSTPTYSQPPTPTTQISKKTFPTDSLNTTTKTSTTLVTRTSLSTSPEPSNQKPTPSEVTIISEMSTTLTPPGIPFTSSYSALIPTIPNPSTKSFYCDPVCCNQTEGFTTILNGNCQKFIVCVDGKQNIFTCSNNLQYNTEIGGCDYPENVNCPWPKTPPSGPSAGPSGTYCEKGGRCVGQTDGVAFASMNGTCSPDYIVCQCECEVQRSCSPQLAFNAEYGVCDWPTNFDC